MASFIKNTLYYCIYSTANSRPASFHSLSKFHLKSHPNLFFSVRTANNFHLNSPSKYFVSTGNFFHSFPFKVLLSIKSSFLLTSIPNNSFHSNNCFSLLKISFRRLSKNFSPAYSLILSRVIT